MALFDMPLEKLKKYRPTSTAQSDFDRFWKKTLAESRGFELSPSFVRVYDPAYRTVEVYDVTFAGYLGQPVKGWFIRPVGVAGKLPCVIHYIGYGGGRSFPVDHLQYAAAGLATLVMDTRGQGSVWSPGHTPDPAPGGPQTPGFMTRGIDSREHYYYRRVYTDAARAVEAATKAPGVDPKRIAVSGGSQGGGISIAAAALASDKVKVLMADVPFLCHFRRATTLVDSSPYQEISQYLKTHRDRVEDVFRTLSYFDGMNLARRVKARSLFSVGLMDNICPPSTVFAAYNAVKAPKEMRVYRFNQHEGGGVFQTLERSRFAVKHL